MLPSALGMDIKYGYIAGTKQFFFQLSLIDVMDREVISYHLGLSALPWMQ